MKPKTLFILPAKWVLILILGILLAGLPEKMKAQQPAGGTDEPTAIGSSFTYEGRLSNNDGNPAEGVYDFVFKLHDSLAGTGLVGNPVVLDNVPVTAGVYRVELDFGRGIFTGYMRYLEIGVRPGNSGGPYTTISLRQLLPITPYALALPGLWTQPNSISPNLIGGNSANMMTTGVAGGTIAGGGAKGFSQRITDDFGVIGGGRNNQAGDNAGTTGDGAYATVAGGLANMAGSAYTTVGGGWLNMATGSFSSIGGGSQNSAEGLYATIGGGLDNTAGGVQSSIGGGWLNQANNAYATISGGYSNQADEVYSTIGGGSYNSAHGSWAVTGGGYNNSTGGAYSVIPGGRDNLAQGDYSFAAGYGAKANAAGCFVWADASKIDLPCNEANRFMARANGGVYFFTSPDLNSGAALPPGSGSWATWSDREAKTNFAPVDSQELLTRLSDLPIQTWNYKTQAPSIRHMGPTAQDFQAAFGVGEDDRHISTVDADGVTMAAIQGLYELTQEQAMQIEAQQEQITTLEARLAALEALVEKQIEPK
jgi:hypothetical protein